MVNIKEPPFLQSVIPDDSIPWQEWLRDITPRMNERALITAGTNYYYVVVNDGVTAIAITIQAAFNAAPTYKTVGAIVYFPPGWYNPVAAITGGALGRDAFLHVKGDGAASQIYQMTANVNLFTIGTDADNTYNVVFEDLWLGTAVGTGYAMALSRVHNSVLRNIKIPVAGAGGIRMNGCIGNTLINPVISTNSGIKSAGQQPNAGIGTRGISIEYNIAASMGSNENTILIPIIEGSATTTEGIYLLGPTGKGEGNTTIIGGVIEGMIGGAGVQYGLYAENIPGLKVIGTHFESNKTADVYLKGCVGAVIDPSHSERVILDDCRACVLKGDILNYVIMSNCEGTDVSGVKCYLPNTGFQDRVASTGANSTVALGSAGPMNYQTGTDRGIISRNHTIFMSNMEEWIAGLPTGFVNHGVATIAQTGTGQPDTTTLYGDYACRITGVDANQFEGLEYVIPTAYRGQWISVEACVRLTLDTDETPDAITCPFYLQAWRGGGTYLGQSTMPDFTTTEWVIMRGSFFFPLGGATTLSIILGKYAQGTGGAFNYLYVDSVKIWGQFDPVDVTATNGQLLIGSTGADPVLALITGTANRIVVTPGAGSITLNGPQDLHTAASPTFAIPNLTGVRIATGANAYMGTATLVAGTVTVNNNHVKAATNIILTPQDNNTTGTCRISARIVDTSFTILSTNLADTGEVAWIFADPV